MLAGASVLLNAAGPFSHTALPLIRACLRAGVSYLDLSGEVDSLALAASYDARARDADTMIMPAVGFDVVPSDCLASMLAERMPQARALHIAVSGLEHFSRGSARSMAEQIGRPIRARRGGVLVRIAEREAWHSADFGHGLRAVRAVDWGDLVTAPFTTGIADVTTYFEATVALRMSLLWRHRVLMAPAWQVWLQTITAALPEGPSARQRAAARCRLVATADGACGEHAQVACETPDAYDFSAAAACEIARRVSEGDREPGFQTPARVYGSQLLASLPGTAVSEVAFS
jgi:short subunit dehydrogenase-like uncharacterized protein